MGEVNSRSNMLDSYKRELSEMFKYLYKLTKWELVTLISVTSQYLYTLYCTSENKQRDKCDIYANIVELKLGVEWGSYGKDLFLLNDKLCNNYGDVDVMKSLEVVYNEIDKLSKFIQYLGFGSTDNSGNVLDDLTDSSKEE